MKWQLPYRTVHPNKKGKQPDVSVLWDDRPEWSTLIVLVLFMVALLIWASVEMNELKKENALLKKQDFSNELQRQSDHKQISQPQFNYE